MIDIRDSGSFYRVVLWRVLFISRFISWPVLAALPPAITFLFQPAGRKKGQTAAPVLLTSIVAGWAILHAKSIQIQVFYAPGLKISQLCKLAKSASFLAPAAAAPSAAIFSLISVCFYHRAIPNSPRVIILPHRKPSYLAGC